MEVDTGARPLFRVPVGSSLNKTKAASTARPAAMASATHWIVAFRFLLRLAKADSVIPIRTALDCSAPFFPRAAVDALAQEVSGHIAPQVGGQGQRFDVDTFVVSVESPSEISGVELRTKQPGTVSH